MTATVYIWKNSPSNVGHVSMMVDDTYVSFWPKSAADAKKDIKVNQTHEAVFPDNYKIDRRLERRDPDSTISILNLDEKLMIDHWTKFKAKPDRYNMRKSNCSTVVASLLELGSGTPPAHSPSIRITDYVINPYLRWLVKLRFLGNYIHMWTPNDVLMYTLQIKSKKVK